MQVMGLLLSTLVFCVGVIELVTFYNNVRRHVEYPQGRRSLSHIRDGYIQELRNTRRKLIEDLEKIKDNESKNVVRDHKKLRNIPTFRLNSHEDIEVECSESIVRSKSTSPRRFLVTEKESRNDTSESRRCFVVSEETHAIRKSKSQSSLPEFSIREEENSEKSPQCPRYVLQEQQGTGERPIPLPSQFIVSETELSTILFQDDKVDTNNKTEYVTRYPSPFPTLELPQNIIESASLDAVQEEQKSRSVSPTTVIERVPQQQGIACKDQVVDVTPISVAGRIRSKSESDNNDFSQRCLDCQAKTSSASQLVDAMTKIELELEEALEENDSTSSKHNDMVKASSEMKTRNVGNNEIGTIRTD